jgi:hypothetical protein
MSTHLVAYEAYDVFQNAIPNATDEVSVDGGQTYRQLQGKEATDGFETPDGSKFVARISTRGMWPVNQPLVIKEDDHLDFDGDRDFGAAPLFSHSTGQPGRWRHLLHSAMTLLRDGASDRRNHGCPDLPAYSHNLLAFDGASVLTTSGRGLSRLAGRVVPNVPSHATADSGDVLFLKSITGATLPGSSSVVPELTAAYVPKGLDLAQPVPIHLFFSPNTANKHGDYPYGPEFTAMIDNYLVSGGKRFLNQLNASQKQCVFVFPLAPREGQFAGLMPASRLRRFLLEVVYCLHRVVAGVRFPFVEPRISICTLSAFSAGALPLVEVMKTSMHGEFPELLECYSLDGVGKELSPTFDAWWRGGAGGRTVRMYSSQLPDAHPSFASAVTMRSGQAWESSRPSATYTYTPLEFWRTVCLENNETGVASGYFKPPTKPTDPSPEVPLTDWTSEVHQLIPELFLEHALRNSALPSR